MQSIFSSALSEAISKHIRLSPARQETQAWLALLMRLKTGELLVLAASANPRRALADYRRGGTIETMFGNLKTRGFNLEGTHITDRGKLSTLVAVVVLVLPSLCVKTGVAMARLKLIPLKKRGRKAVSLFALGLHVLCKIFAAQPNLQITGFLKALLRLPVWRARLLSQPVGRPLA